MRTGQTFSISNTRQYNILAGMKQRCYNPKNSHYAIYGGRGIDICPEWLGENGALNFYEWSLEHGYDDTMSIDRVDNDKGYSPSNCVWMPCEVNSPGKNLFVKLFYIIHRVPTFEIEYLKRHIEAVPNEKDRQRLLQELAEADRLHHRRRLRGRKRKVST